MVKPLSQLWRKALALPATRSNGASYFARGRVKERGCGECALVTKSLLILIDESLRWQPRAKGTGGQAHFHWHAPMLIGPLIASLLPLPR